MTAAHSIEEFLKVPTDFYEVILHAQKIDLMSAQKLANALRCNKKLVGFTIKHSEIGIEALNLITEALPGCYNLQQLVLSSNKIDEQGAFLIANCLPGFRNLEKLYLDNNLIGDNGIKAISESLIENRKLSELSVAKNNIGDEGAISLAEALIQTPSLQHLSIAKNQISDAGIKNIVEALGSYYKITILDLSHNFIGNHGAEAILNTLGDIYSFKLTIHNNCIEEATVNILKTKLGPRLIAFSQKSKESKSIEEYPSEDSVVPPGGAVVKDAYSKQGSQKEFAIKLAEYIDALESEPKNIEKYNELGKLFQSQGDYKKALDCYLVSNNYAYVNECFKLWSNNDKENPDIWIKRGDYAYSVAEHQRAVKYYQNALGLSRDEEFKLLAIQKVTTALKYPGSEFEAKLTIEDIVSPHFPEDIDEFVAYISGAAE
jgi:tetratricopeptide (TPR) repeat protein